MASRLRLSCVTGVAHELIKNTELVSGWCVLPNGVAQAILVVGRVSCGYSFEFPITIVRNSSLATMLVSNARLDFRLRRMASSNFDFHVDCTPSFSVKSRVVPPKRPSWWMTRRNIARGSPGGGAIPLISAGRVAERPLPLTLIDPFRNGEEAYVSTLRRSSGIGYPRYP